MRQQTCAPSQEVRARRLSKNGRNDGNSVLPVEGTTVKEIRCTISNKDVIGKVGFLFEHTPYTQ